MDEAEVRPTLREVPTVEMDERWLKYESDRVEDKLEGARDVREGEGEWKDDDKDGVRIAGAWRARARRPKRSRRVTMRWRSPSLGG